MGFFEIFAIAVGLAMDAFAVSLSAGTNNMVSGKRANFRISFHFGLFQGFMPVIGWFAGVRIAPFIESVDHWVVFVLLSVIGAKMIKSGLDPEMDVKRVDPSRGFNLILLSVATSIDALAVGFSLAMLNIRIWYPSVIIGVVTGLLSLIGVLVGNRLGIRFGKSMEIVGGIVLVAIGLRILIDHLFFL